MTAFWAGILVALSLAAQAEPPELDVVLGRLARTAELFRDTTLEFACREQIRWRGSGDPGSAAFEYLFVYEEDGGFKDYRTTPFLGKRRKAPPEVSPADYDVPWFLRSAYLWIFTFRESRQSLHKYKILGEEEVLGVKAVMIEFEPVRPIRPTVNDWYGVAWVDPTLGQLLKVVAFAPDDHQTKKDFEETILGNIVDEVKAEYGNVTTVFSEEHNGLRFPGTVVLEHSAHVWKKKSDEVKKKYRREKGRSLLDEPDGVPRRKVLLRVEQSYRKYQFFSVRTEEDVQDYILRRGRHRAP